MFCAQYFARIAMTSYEAEWGVRLILDLMLCMSAGDTVFRLSFCRKNSLNDCSCCSSVRYCGEERIMLRKSRSSSLLSAPSRYIMSLRRKSCSLPNAFITRRSFEVFMIKKVENVCVGVRKRRSIKQPKYTYYLLLMKPVSRLRYRRFWLWVGGGLYSREIGRRTVVCL